LDRDFCCIDETGVLKLGRSIEMVQFLELGLSLGTTEHSALPKSIDEVDAHLKLFFKQPVEYIGRF
jgi:hypothetical protein